MTTGWKFLCKAIPKKLNKLSYNGGKIASHCQTMSKRCDYQCAEEYSHRHEFFPALLAFNNV